MIADAGYIGDHAACFVRKGEPVDEVARIGSRTLPNVLPAVSSTCAVSRLFFRRSRMMESVKECHPAIGVMDHEPFLCSEQLVGDDKGSYRVVAGATARIANHVGVAFAQARILRRIKPGVHACQYREASGRRQSESCLVAESFGVVAIGGKRLQSGFCSYKYVWSVVGLVASDPTLRQSADSPEILPN